MKRFGREFLAIFLRELNKSEILYTYLTFLDIRGPMAKIKSDIEVLEPLKLNQYLTFLKKYNIPNHNTFSPMGRHIAN